MEMNIKVHSGGKLPKINKGDMADLYNATVGIIRAEDVKEIIKFDDFSIEWHCQLKDKEVKLNAGDIVIVDLGISVEMPENWYCKVYPRSSTFTKFGLLLTNSVGIIDHLYKGNDDIWKGVFYATRKSTLKLDIPLLQFEPKENTLSNFTINQVDNLEHASRGGFGSTDKKQIDSITVGAYDSIQVGGTNVDYSSKFRTYFEPTSIDWSSKEIEQSTPINIEPLRFDPQITLSVEDIKNLKEIAEMKDLMCQAGKAFISNNNNETTITKE